MDSVGFPSGRGRGDHPVFSASGAPAGRPGTMDTPPRGSPTGAARAAWPASRHMSRSAERSRTAVRDRRNRPHRADTTGGSRGPCRPRRPSRGGVRSPAALSLRRGVCGSLPRTAKACGASHVSRDREPRAPAVSFNAGNPRVDPDVTNGPAVDRGGQECPRRDATPSPGSAQSRYHSKAPGPATRRREIGPCSRPHAENPGPPIPPRWRPASQGPRTVPDHKGKSGIGLRAPDEADLRVVASGVMGHDLVPDEVWEVVEPLLPGEPAKPKAARGCRTAMPCVGSCSRCALACHGRCRRARCSAARA